MNYLNILAKNIIFSRKKHKLNKLKSFWALGVLGVTVGSVGVVLFTKGCCEKIKNVDINNVEDNSDDSSEGIDKDINKEVDKNIDEDDNINTDEIMETLEHLGEESLGDVGLAMEHAIEDLDEEEKSENKTKNL